MTPSIESRTLQIPAGVDAGTEIPLTTIRGARPGPVLALVAGNHGYEYPPILALQRLRGVIDPATLSGTVLMVHVANMPSFLGRTVYFSPIDGKNLNRVYPGRADGTVSERIAYAITREVIDKADCLLDLHCGDGNESLRPYVYQTVTPDEQMNAAIARLALAFGIDHILIDRNRPTDPERSLYCSTTAITRWKPAITIEAGFLGTTDEASVQQIVAGVQGVMRELKMLETGPPPVAKPVFLDPSEVIFSPATGILYPMVERGQMVAKGDLLAYLTDFFGTRIAEIRSPLDGVVLYIVATPPMTEGQPAGCIGQIGT
ncbi:MAG: succinylglutamate desuccinylase/aspartoacylase family protein [Candidatus Sulfopaludibacter sp.]|nr:succinylglutamate desuccinylase/aspartoacylase family protein [Candidatus Sulfopaludibacter sp.]